MRSAGRQALLAGLVLLVSTVSTADDPLLDLSKYTLASLRIPAELTPASRRDAAFPIRVRLLRTDRKQYRRMEVAIYDVSFENVSKSPVVIPWAAESATSPPPGTPGEQWLTVEFVLTRGNGADAPLRGIPLHGAPAFPGTLRTLAPGERVIIRASARLNSESSTDDVTNAMLSGSINVRAKVLVMFGRGAGTSPARVLASENTLAFRIVPTVSPFPIPPPTHEPPVILAVTPAVASPGTIIRIDGYRLGVEYFLRPGVVGPSPRYYLSNGSTRVPLLLKGRSLTGPDSNTSRQMVQVEMPEGVLPGAWNVLAVVDGAEASSPYPIEASEWKPPHIDRLTLERVNPGDIVGIGGSNLGPDASIEVTDSTGRLVDRGRRTGNGSTFIVPREAADGQASVKVRVLRDGTWHSSEPFAFIITHEPLPPSLSNQTRRAVGAGQWTDLEGFSATTLSERIEAEFTQGPQVVLTETESAVSPHVRVPATLMPGIATVRVRIWFGGAASGWSAPKTYRVALSAVAPVVTSINVGPSMLKVPLQGPIVPARFDVQCGEDMILLGLFPVAETTPIQVSLERRGEKIALKSSRMSGSVRVAVPAHIDHGPWNVVVGAVDGAPALTLPAVMYVR
jgi:hypothetical protein